MDKYTETQSSDNKIYIIKGEHPEMFIGTPYHDKRLDIITDSVYTNNSETYD